MSRDKGEADVAHDPQTAGNRDTGGVPNRHAPDQATTTGTTPNEEFVGRVGGEDVGYEEETGAERRAEAEDRSGDS